MSASCVASVPSHPLKWEPCQFPLHVSSQDPSKIGCAPGSARCPQHQAWNFPAEFPFCSAAGGNLTLHCLALQADVQVDSPTAVPGDARQVGPTQGMAGGLSREFGPQN